MEGHCKVFCSGLNWCSQNQNIKTYNYLLIQIEIVHPLLNLLTKALGGSLTFLHKPAIGPDLEQDLTSLQHDKPTSLKFILILSSHLRLGLPKSLFPSGFPNKTLYAFLVSFMRPAHLSRFDLRFLILLDEEYNACSSALCNFLHYWKFNYQSNVLCWLVVKFKEKEIISWTWTRTSSFTW